MARLCTGHAPQQKSPNCAGAPNTLAESGRPAGQRKVQRCWLGQGIFCPMSALALPGRKKCACYFFARGGKPVCWVSNWPFWGAADRLPAVDKDTDDLAPRPVLFLRRALW